MLVMGPMLRGALCGLFVAALLSPGAAHSAYGQGGEAEHMEATPGNAPSPPPLSPLSPPPPPAPVEFQLFMHRARADAPPAFLGFTIDWNNATLDSSWAGADLVEIDLGDERLRRFASALSPAVLRVGGSLADVATYAVGDDPPPCPRPTCLQMARWLELVDFASSCGLSLLFDLNIMLGRKTDPKSPGAGTDIKSGAGTDIKSGAGTDIKSGAGNGVGPGSARAGGGGFDVSNIRSLLEYTAERGLDVWGFELGNEKQVELTPIEAAEALGQVKAIIDELWPGADDDARPRLVGPALNPRPDWLEEMMVVGGGAAVDGVSYHSYSGYGMSSDLDLLISDPAWIDFPLGVSLQNLQAIRNSGFHSMPLYVSETAMAWSSCRSGICDAFMAGFWYVNMLASSASNGIKGVYRQTLSGGHYGLLDQTRGFLPRPDYWTAVLFQRLASPRWLYTHQSEPGHRNFVPHVRCYATCAKGGGASKGGGVALVFSNTHRVQAYVYRGLHSPEWAGPWVNLSTTPRHEYILTAPGQNISSQGIMLNGAELKLTAEGMLPPLPPKVVGIGGADLVFPPLSYGYIVLPDVLAPACFSFRSKTVNRQGINNGRHTSEKGARRVSPPPEHAVVVS